MFRCQVCDTVVPPNVRSEKLVVKTRPKEYAARDLASPNRRSRGWRGRPRSRKSYDKGGQGREIVQELVVCPHCSERHHPARKA